MKLFHLSDLHLGKRVNGYSLLEDQRDILTKILALAETERPDAVLIAGDVYDKTLPPAEAVTLFDDFLTALAAQKRRVLLISGNHDSPERLAFGGRLLAPEGVYLAPAFAGAPAPLTLLDEHGPVDFYLLPFVKPAHVRQCWPEEADRIATYTDALRTVLAHAAPDTARRNVLLAHQFVTGAARSESEEISVGGSDNVDAAVFDDFDYVALGHLHGPQQAGRPTLRYCGTPMAYSFAEAGQQKSVTVVELGKKGEIALRTLPLTPLRAWCELKGSYAELTARGYYQNTTWDTDYIHITLTDEEDIPDAIGRLRSIYHDLMTLDYDNRRTRSGAALPTPEDVDKRQPIELFLEFYEKQNGRPLTARQHDFCRDLIEKLWEEPV